MFNNILIYFRYILGTEIMFDTSSFGIWMFRIISDIYLGSDRTHNLKYHKTRFIRYLCWILIDLDFFLSERTLEFPGSIYFSALSRAISKHKNSAYMKSHVRSTPNEVISGVCFCFRHFSKILRPSSTKSFS